MLVFVCLRPIETMVRAIFVPAWAGSPASLCFVGATIGRHLGVLAAEAC